MRRLVIVVFACLPFISTGCSAPARLDTSSDDALKQSMARITEGMTADQKQQLFSDCMSIVMPAQLTDMLKNTMHSAFTHEKMPAAPTSAELMRPLDGMTAAEIHAKAEEVRAARRVAVTSPSGVVSVDSKKPAIAETDWIPHNKVVRKDDLQIKILQVSVGKVPLESGLGKSESQDEALMVKLELTNINPNKKLEYLSWAGRGMLADPGLATIKDNFGNKYKRIDFGYSTTPVWGVERSESLYPHKAITEMLVFQTPIDTATNLDLELPASNYGGVGIIPYRIPISAVSHGTD